MILLVHGFPSKVAALQFEHAWQHGYRTHYIQDELRIVKNKNVGRSIHHKLATVRLLVGNAYFESMNLTVEFFNCETRQMWDQNKLQVQDNPLSNLSIVPKALGVVDVSSPETIESFANAHLRLIETFYGDQIEKYQVNCEKFKQWLTLGEIACQICEESFDYTSEEEERKPLVGFCVFENCDFVSHLGCLHRYFIDDEQLLSGGRILVPKAGKCPNCSRVNLWKEIVKYATAMKACYGS